MHSRVFQNPAIAVAVLLGACASSAADPAAAGPGRDGPRETGFLNRTASAGGAARRYQVYVPSDWTPDRAWPVILFLHGSGERGDDGLVETEVGIGTAIRRHAERFPCLVVFPQCRKDVWWSDPGMEEMTLKALEQTVAEFHGDRSRIVLTGLSMGGYGTWSLAAKHPGTFAALAPLCGGIRRPKGHEPPPGSPEANLPPDPYGATAEKIGKTPVWIVHGAADPVVPPDESRKMAKALQDAGSAAKLTEYEGVGHTCWDKAYADAAFIAWMLEQKRGP